MRWEHAFIAVPTQWLDVNRAEVSPTAKMNPARMREAMESVPALYRLQADGYTAEDFRQMAASPDPDKRLLGETYQHLFSGSPGAQPIRADFVDGQGLVVQAGQHRVLAAQQAGVSALPVHVAVRDREDLEKLRAACDARVRGMGPNYTSAPDVQRAHQERQGQDHSLRRSAGEMWERHIDGDRFNPERETRRQTPERRR